MSDVKHFKLVNQEEIICKVIEWDTEESRDIIVSSVLKIDPKLSEDTSYRYFTFSPWMALQESLLATQALNGDMIVAIGNPSETALDYYNDVVAELSDTNEGGHDIVMMQDSDLTSVMSSSIQLH